MSSTSEVVNQINESLTTKKLIIPDGKKLAVIVNASYDDSNNLKAQAGVAVKIGDEWHVGIVTDWSHHSGLSEGIYLEWSK